MSDLKQKILNYAAPDLMRIEASLRENLGAHLDIVEKVAGHILFGGGKRLRPLLMIFCARLCNYSGNRDAFYAIMFEYLHAATLVHDDLIDGATLRRGRKAAHLVYGNEMAVLTGDFLLARSLTIASETRNLKVIRIIASITENMSQGEIHQLSRKQHLDLTEGEYNEIIRRKTAVLIEGACQVGALVSDAQSAQVTALAEYGYHLGMAFQMADDLLDYTADTATLGKAVGADLREGKLTLPVIYALQNASGADQTRMREIILNPEFTAADFDALVMLLNQYDGIDYTRRRAEAHIAEARARLTGFDDSPAREILDDIAGYALIRKA